MKIPTNSKLIHKTEIKNKQKNPRAEKEQKRIGIKNKDNSYKTNQKWCLLKHDSITLYISGT